jgi:hypothetical protein
MNPTGVADYLAGRTSGRSFRDPEITAVDSGFGVD